MSTIDPAEIKKFSDLAATWWDEEGPFKPLHRFNPIRITYIKEQIKAHFGSDIAEKEIIDIGCGGGLISEPFARLGAKMTSIDAAEKNIKAASLHAEKMNLSVDYRHSTAEDEAAKNKQYDVVLALEIIEHVADVPAFLEACTSLVKPGGMLFVATLNRTVKSYLFAIVGAEYVLRWLPKGTHEWSRFLKPSEIESETKQHALTLQHASGFTLNPITNQWSKSTDLAVNYMMAFGKE